MGESDFGEFPWTVAIFITPNTYRAGGSLIAPNVVLSSASLLDVKYELKVRAGDWDLMTDNEYLEYQEILVNQTIIHPNYEFDTNENNIALLILQSGFSLKQNFGHIRPICLPPKILRWTTATALFPAGINVAKID